MVGRDVTRGKMDGVLSLVAVDKRLRRQEYRGEWQYQSGEIFFISRGFVCRDETSEATQRFNRLLWPAMRKWQRQESSLSMAGINNMYAAQRNEMEDLTLVAHHHAFAHLT